MVKKIKKKSKKGPGAKFAIPMAMPLTCLYGLRLEGRDFRQIFDTPGKVREVLLTHLLQEVMIGDRVLSRAEYLQWGLKSAPGRLAGMFSRSGTIPMGPPVNELEEDAQPRLGILTLLALVKGKELEGFLRRGMQEFSEVLQVAFQNSVRTCFSLIPGYDQLIYSPPCHVRDLNGAISFLNNMVEESFYRAGVPFPGPFEVFEGSILSSIPLNEAIRSNLVL
ncbi:MAG: hypothetical protein L0Y56_02620 [Nitrospira sp.]|nr:hypothetical protein [Nitrospira sp.]